MGPGLPGGQGRESLSRPCQREAGVTLQSEFAPQGGGCWKPEYGAEKLFLTRVCLYLSAHCSFSNHPAEALTPLRGISAPVHL